MGADLLLPSSCNTYEPLFCKILNNSAKHHIPQGYIPNMMPNLTGIAKRLINDRDINDRDINDGDIKDREINDREINDRDINDRGINDIDALRSSYPSDYYVPIAIT